MSASKAPDHCFPPAPEPAPARASKRFPTAIVFVGAALLLLHEAKFHILEWAARLSLDPVLLTGLAVLTMAVSGVALRKTPGRLALFWLFCVFSAGMIWDGNLLFLFVVFPPGAAALCLLCLSAILAIGLFLFSARHRWRVLFLVVVLQAAFLVWFGVMGHLQLSAANAFLRDAQHITVSGEVTSRRSVPPKLGEKKLVEHTEKALSPGETRALLGHATPELLKFELWKRGAYDGLAVTDKGRRFDLRVHRVHDAFMVKGLHVVFRLDPHRFTLDGREVTAGELIRLPDPLEDWMLEKLKSRKSGAGRHPSPANPPT